MRTNPCKDCKDRYVGCHWSCGAYLSWAAERRELNRKRQAEDKLACDINDIHALSIKRVKNGQDARSRKEKKK